MQQAYNYNHSVIRLTSLYIVIVWSSYTHREWEKFLENLSIHLHPSYQRAIPANLDTSTTHT
jgi:hypothetical protein